MLAGVVWSVEIDQAVDQLNTIMKFAKAEMLSSGLVRIRRAD
jgi:hypothetical protein